MPINLKTQAEVILVESRNILHLTLKKKWFDLILAGEKIVEYREVKPYWIKRFFLFDKQNINIENINILDLKKLEQKTYHKIIFKNGYSKNAPVFEIELKFIEIQENIKTPLGVGDFFVLHLGKVIKR